MPTTMVPPSPFAKAISVSANTSMSGSVRYSTSWPGPALRAVEVNMNDSRQSAAVFARFFFNQFARLSDKRFGIQDDLIGFIFCGARIRLVITANSVLQRTREA